MIQHISLTTQVGAGTVTSGAPIHGELLALYVANSSAGTVTVVTTGPAPVTIASLTGGAGTAWYYPRRQGCDVGGTVISGVYETIPLNNYVTFGINAAGTATCTLAIES